MENLKTLKEVSPEELEAARKKKEQAEIVNQSMEEYLDSMVQAEQEALSGDNYKS